MNLAKAFALTVQSMGGKTAIYWGSEELTYPALLQQSSQVARRLHQEFGVKQGDHVGIWLKNCPQFIPALFGILQLGAVAVPINNFLKPNEVSYIAADAGLEVIITEAGFIEAARAAQAAELASRKFLKIEDLTAGLDPDLGEAPHPHLNEASLALIIYTSGTTGKPKGAMLTHGNLLHNVESCRQILAVVDHDRFVLLLPMFHSFMICVCIFLPLLVGGSIVLVKSLHPAKSAMQEIIARQATILPAFPQFFRTLVDIPLPTDLPVRLCVSGAAPLPVQVLRDFNRRHPHIILLEGYGLSEASPVVSINPVKGPWKEGSIGVPIPHVEVTIQDDSGRMLPSGQIGEICVRGGNIMSGYWHQPQATAEALRQGWLLTGDVGYMDSDGYFFITDRKKDMLLVNGINVYPREIEEVLYQFPGVKEVAVISQPDSRKGEQAVAFVAPQEGMAVDDRGLINFAKQHLADYKVPRRVLFLPALPRNATGKILKTALREMCKRVDFQETQLPNLM